MFALLRTDRIFKKTAKICDLYVVSGALVCNYYCQLIRILKIGHI